MREELFLTNELMRRSDTKKRCRMYFYDHTTIAHADAQTQGELLVYNSGDKSSDGRISENGIIFQDNFNKDTDFTIGTVACNYVTVSLLNDDGGLNNFNWNRCCRIYLDVLDPNATQEQIENGEAWYSVSMGIYVFEKPRKIKTRIVEATGYDLASTLDEIADDWWNNLDFSNGLTASDIFDLSGLDQFDNASFDWSDAFTYAYTSRPFDAVQLTYRDIFGKLAESGGAKVFVRDATLCFHQFHEAFDGVSHTYEYDFSAIGSGLLNIDVSEYQVSPVDKLKIANSEYDFGTIVGTGENAYIISNNPFLYSMSQAGLESRAQSILDYLSNMTHYGDVQNYTPLSIECIGSPVTEAGDVVNIVYEGTTYALPIFQQVITYRGGLIKVKMWSSGNPKREPLTAQNRSEFRGQKQVHEIIINTNMLLSRINDFNGSGSTIEQTINGINTTVSGKVGNDEVISAINQSAEQITINANKVNLQGYVTVTNLSTEGQTVINGSNITTGSLSADRIRGGTLVLGGINDSNGVINVLDASGAISDTWDKDGIKIKGVLISSYTSDEYTSQARLARGSIEFSSTDGGTVYISRNAGVFPWIFACHPNDSTYVFSSGIDYVNIGSKTGSASNTKLRLNGKEIGAPTYVSIPKASSFGASSYSVYAYTWPALDLGVLQYNITLPALDAATETLVCNMPVGTRSWGTFYHDVITRLGNPVLIRTYADGRLTVYSNTAIPAQAIRGTLTFPLQPNQ